MIVNANEYGWNFNNIGDLIMGVIFGIINILVAVWFFSSAVSVKKQAVMWAIIGGLSFICFKFLGYSMIGFLQGSLDQNIISDLVDQGYIQSEKSTRELSNETYDEQSIIAGIFFEFFPLIVALLGVSFIRAKFILSMDYIPSLKHKTSLILKTNSFLENTSNEAPTLKGTVSAWWKNIRKS